MYFEPLDLKKIKIIIDDGKIDKNMPKHCKCEYWRCQNYYANLCCDCDGKDHFHEDN